MINKAMLFLTGHYKGTKVVAPVTKGIQLSATGKDYKDPAFQCPCP